MACRLLRRRDSDLVLAGYALSTDWVGKHGGDVGDWAAWSRIVFVVFPLGRVIVLINDFVPGISDLKKKSCSAQDLYGVCSYAWP